MTPLYLLAQDRAHFWTILKTFPWADRAHTSGFCSHICANKSLKYEPDRPTGRFSKLSYSAQNLPYPALSQDRAPPPGLGIHFPTTLFSQKPPLNLFSIQCLNLVARGTSTPPGPPPGRLGVKVRKKRINIFCCVDWPGVY